MQTDSMHLFPQVKRCAEVEGQVNSHQACIRVATISGCWTAGPAVRPYVLDRRGDRGLCVPCLVIAPSQAYRIHVKPTPTVYLEHLSVQNFWIWDFASAGLSIMSFY